MDFGGGPLASASGLGHFLAKFDPDVTIFWGNASATQRRPGRTTDSTADGSGHVFLSGAFQGRWTSAAGRSTSAGSQTSSSPSSTAQAPPPSVGGIRSSPDGRHYHQAGISADHGLGHAFGVVALSPVAAIGATGWYAAEAEPRNA